MLFIVIPPCNENLLEEVPRLNKRLQRRVGGHWSGMLPFSYNVAQPIDSASDLRFLFLFMVHDCKVDIIPFYLFSFPRFQIFLSLYFK